MGTRIAEIKRDFASMIREQLRGEITKTMNIVDIPNDITCEEAIELVKTTVQFRNNLRKRLREMRVESCSGE